eukprot:SAG11_NODE_19154_length_473_cov_0.826203_1_plen_91_part_10
MFITVTPKLLTHGSPGVSRSPRGDGWGEVGRAMFRSPAGRSRHPAVAACDRSSHGRPLGDRGRLSARGLPPARGRSTHTLNALTTTPDSRG